MAKERIQKVLARSNVGSRRAVEQMLLEGRIRLNGKPVNTLGIAIDPAVDQVQVNGRQVTLFSEENQDKVYLLLHKPSGVVTTTKDDRGRSTVLDLIPQAQKQRLYPVGRLDYDAQGALLLTNDGDLANKLMHPKFRFKKTYLVKVKGVPTEDGLNLLRRGIYLEDGATGPSSIEFMRKTRCNSWFRVVISQGKYRQIKRMFWRIENPVMRLLRIDFAGISLGELPMGRYRELHPKEIRVLQKQIEAVSSQERK